MSELQTYVAPGSPNLRVTIEVDGCETQLQFDHHGIKVDELTAIALDEVLAHPKNAALARKVQKVDKAKAEALVKAHMAQRRGGPISGGMHSEHGKQLEARDAALRLQGASDADLTKLRQDVEADSGLILTEKVDAPKQTPLQEKSATKLLLGAKT